MYLDFRSELSRFHYVGQNYIDLVIYLNSGCDAFLLEAIAAQLAKLTDHSYWHDFDAANVNLEEIKAEIASEIIGMTTDFCEFSESIPENFLDAFAAEVWFETMLLYSAYSMDLANFLKRVSSTIVRNKEVFSEQSIGHFVAMMVEAGMVAEVQRFGSELGCTIVCMTPEELEQAEGLFPPENSFTKYVKDIFSSLGDDKRPEVLN